MDLLIGGVKLDFEINSVKEVELDGGLGWHNHSVNRSIGLCLERDGSIRSIPSIG
jgi:hypothetical protein